MGGHDVVLYSRSMRRGEGQTALCDVIAVFEQKLSFFFYESTNDDNTARSYWIITLIMH